MVPTVPTGCRTTQVEGLLRHPTGFRRFLRDNGVRWPAHLCVFVCKPIQLSNTKDI